MAEGNSGQVISAPIPSPSLRRTTPDGDDIMKRLESVANVIRQIGQVAAERGETERRDCENFATELLVQARSRLGAIVTKRRGILEDLERVIGQLGQHGA